MQWHLPDLILNKFINSVPYTYFSYYYLKDNYFNLKTSYLYKNSKKINYKKYINFIFPNFKILK